MGPPKSVLATGGLGCHREARDTRGPLQLQQSAILGRSGLPGACLSLSAISGFPCGAPTGPGALRQPISSGPLFSCLLQPGGDLLVQSCVLGDSLSLHILSSWRSKWGAKGRLQPEGRMGCLLRSRAPSCWLSPQPLLCRTCSGPSTEVSGQWGLPPGREAGGLELETTLSSRISCCTHALPLPLPLLSLLPPSSPQQHQRYF